MSEFWKVARHKHPFHVSRNERCSMLILTWKGFFLACLRSVDLSSASDSMIQKGLKSNTACNCCERMRQLVGCFFGGDFRSDRLKKHGDAGDAGDASTATSYEVGADRIFDVEMQLSTL